MNKPNEGTLMKQRSHLACLSAGYKLYTSNFKAIFTSSWISAILYSLACGALGVISLFEMPRFTLMILANNNPESPFYTSPEFITFTAIFLSVIILGGLFEVLFYSCNISLLQKHSETSCIPAPAKWYRIDTSAFWRMFKACFFTGCVALIAYIIFALIHIAIIYCFKASDISPVTIARYNIIGSCLISLLVVFLILPFNYIIMRYMINTSDSFWQSIFRKYSTATRHYGQIFSVNLLNAIIYTLCSMIISIPAIILSFANSTATTGHLYGDPLGMPTYIVPLTAVVFVVIGFIQIYLRATFIFPAYYIYGSIETYEAEREKDRMKWTENNDSTN